MKTKSLLLAAGLALIGGAAFLLYQNKNAVNNNLVLPPDEVTTVTTPVTYSPVEDEVATATTPRMYSPEEIKAISADYDPHPKVHFNHSIVTNGDTNTYSSTELGIAFEYPSTWGDVVNYSAEKSACPKESKDPCLQVRVGISNGDAHKVLLVIETPAHSGYYVPGRHGHWGDTAGIPIFRPFGSQCEKFPEECNINTNKHGTEYFIIFRKEPPLYENYPRWIILFSLPNEFYKGMAISLEDPSNPETSESTTAVKTTLTKIAESVRVVK